MPVDLLDLKRTADENHARAAKLEEENKIVMEEDKARKEQDREVMKIPQDPGAYMIEDNKLRIFQAAESKVHTNKGRTVLKILSPLPTVSGKATVELDNAHSTNVVKDPRPEIYIQLSADEQFGIIKLTPKGEVRIADRLQIVPVTKEVIDDIDLVPIFRKQLSDNLLYKNLAGAAHGEWRVCRGPVHAGQDEYADLGFCREDGEVIQTEAWLCIQLGEQLGQLLALVNHRAP